MGKYYTINSTGDLDKVFAENTYVLIDFWATWCPPCVAVAPVFEKLAEAHTNPGNLVLAKVDVDAAPAIAQTYNISSIPTFMLFKNGKAEETVKAANMPKIQAMINTAIQDTTANPRVAAEDKAEAPKDETTVSGSYTLSSNPSWKMQL